MGMRPVVNCDSLTGCQGHGVIWELTIVTARCAQMHCLLCTAPADPVHDVHAARGIHHRLQVPVSVRLRWLALHGDSTCCETGTDSWVRANSP